MLWIAAVLGVVEGLTEFLPISSTGHLILAGSLLGFTGEKVKVFEIAIQTGAIFAIVLMYWRKLSDITISLSRNPVSRRFTFNVIIGFLPAAILGVMFSKSIKAHLFSPVVVATTFILGGLVILWMERRPRVEIRIHSVEEMSPMDALKVGLLQCLALVPGTSRSGSTIIGGMLMGLSRQTATEFSFFLAIPTLIGAGAYSLYKARALLSMADMPMFVTGFLFAFFSAWVCVRWLLKYVSTHNFIPFAWYRIVFGFLVIFTAWMGWVRWAD